MASVFGSAQAADSAEMQPSLYAGRESSSRNGNPENEGAGKKRRLTVEQARSLEMSFEREKKLLQQRKFQLAFELGLKPRQVAVWYQNRRARWKAKQLEEEYDMLKQRYEHVLLEKRELEAEVTRLTLELQVGERQLKDENITCGAVEDETWNNRSSSICSGAPAKPCKELAGQCSDNEQAVLELQQGTQQLWGHLFQSRVSSEGAERGRRNNYRQVAGKSGDDDENMVPQLLYSSDLLAVDGQQVVAVNCLDWLNF